jgi:hypothetical protein
MRYLLVAALALTACTANNSHPPRLNLGDMAQGNQNGADMAGMNQGGCLDAAKLVYVIDANGTLSSFDPPNLAFKDLGKINCGSEPDGTVNSMAIDRNAFAYVNFQSGAVYKVDTQSPQLTCTATKFNPSPNNYTTFGMGFSADSDGSDAETLFVAGAQGLAANNALATLDINSFVPNTVGNLPSWPELTGTGDAKLWGFFPDASNTFVAQIDKTNASLSMKYQLSQLNGNQTAWAFAFWGGDFWIFLQRDSDNSTNVWHLAVFDGGMNVTEAIKDTGREIVGAGVSTCAPTTIG